jgi:hypothetical protein
MTMVWVEINTYRVLIQARQIVSKLVQWKRYSSVLGFQGLKSSLTPVLKTPLILHQLEYSLAHSNQRIKAHRSLGPNF